MNNDSSFSHDENVRYARHFVLPEVGVEGQQKLKAARVLIIGAGGLGSPVALYLAAAGVGTIGIIDFDFVDGSNLQRQILHSTSDIGKAKVFSAKEKINEINPGVTVTMYQEKLTSVNAMKILDTYDVIVDGTDNFPTRYLVNDACVLLRKPLVYGSIFRFEGQVSVFSYGDSPCYRCLYPAPPHISLVQNCSEAGVLGVLPGIIGTIQSAEAVKIILHIGQSLTGKILLVDVLQMSFQEMRLKKNPECPICGTNPTIHSLLDYEEFCGISPRHPKSGNKDTTDEITVFMLKEKLERKEKFFLLDVREPYEYAISNLNGYLIPVHELQNRLNELHREWEIIVHCHQGIRSAQAVQLLKEHGFSNVKNLLGGIDEWSNRIDAAVPKY